jgi:chromosome segregation ATPase
MFELIIAKIEGLEGRFEGLEGRFKGLESRFKGLEDRFEGLESRMDSLDGRLESLESRFEGLESRQGEIYEIAIALEENVRVGRAEIERMGYILAKIEGRLNRITEQVDDHESVIQQIRAIE